MNITLTKRLCLTAMLTLAAAVYTSSAFAETSKLIIESGDSAQSRQQAAMEKEQWNDTRQLRQKVNKRAEKEWDKTDAAFDSPTPCAASTAALAAPLPHNDCTLKDIERIRYD